MRLIITDRTKIIYSMYRAGEVSVHRACSERATQPLEGEIRIIQAQYQQMSENGSRVFTHSLDVLPFHGMCMYNMYNCIYSQSNSCRRFLSLFSLSSCINVFV